MNTTITREQFAFTFEKVFGSDYDKIFYYENLKSIGTKIFQIQKRFPKGSCIFICRIKS